jgi:hypothetical protein
MLLESDDIIVLSEETAHDVSLRLCRDCRQHLPTSDFYKCASRKDGITTICKKAFAYNGKAGRTVLLSATVTAGGVNWFACIAMMSSGEAEIRLRRGASIQAV